MGSSTSNGTPRQGQPIRTPAGQDPAMAAWAQQMQALHAQRPALPPEMQAWQAQRPAGMGNEMQVWQDQRPTEQGGMSAWRDQRPQMNPGQWHDQMMDWRQQRPQFTPSPEMQAYRTQVEALRAQRPTGPQGMPVRNRRGQV